MNFFYCQQFYSMLRMVWSQCFGYFVLFCFLVSLSRFSSTDSNSRYSQNLSEASRQFYPSKRFLFKEKNNNHQDNLSPLPPNNYTQLFLFEPSGVRNYERGASLQFLKVIVLNEANYMKPLFFFIMVCKEKTFSPLKNK